MAVIAVVIIVVGLLYYRYQANIITAATERQLQSIVELQAREIAHWRSERQGDARFYQNNRSFLNLAKARLAADTPANASEFEAWISDTQASHGYEILLLDPNGRLRLATPPDTPGMAATERAAIQDRPDATAPYWVDFYQVEGSDAIRLTLVIPLRDPEVPDDSLGLMLWRINPARQLYPALQKWPVPSETGELALVQRRGEEMVYLAPLRFDPAAALKRKLSMRHVDRPGVQAALGANGVMEGINYRSQRVLAAMTQIPGTPWALLARIDSDEAFSQLHQFRRTTALGIGALLLAALATTAWLWRFVEFRHLRQLQQTHALLQASERQLTTLLEASQTILYSLRWRANRPETAFVSSNIERILGYTAQEAMQPGWWQKHLHPEDQAYATDYLARLGSEDRLTQEYRFLLKDGRTIIVHDELRIVRNEAGQPVEIVGVWTDITHAKSSLEELRLKSAALEAAANAIVITSVDGTIEWANAAFTKLTGYTLGEVIHRNPRAIVKSGIQSEDFYRELWDTILQGRIWSGELVNRRKDGTHYTEEMMIAPVKSESGQITHFIAVKQDVTERKLLQEQFVRAQRLESLGMLASGIAHDLNNMLAPIIFSGPLLRRSLTAEKDLRIVSMLESSAERGAALVKQVVAFAQGGNNSLRITQLKHVARDVVAFAQTTFPKSIRVQSNIPADAWPVMANPSQIHQVLLNLCVNARDAMPESGTLTVAMQNRSLTPEMAGAIRGALAGNWTVLEVSDTGTGIPPEVLPRIYDSFFTTKTQGKGTGLGLTTVRTIVEGHRGFIQLETAVGQGTAFRIFLPASPVQAESPAAGADAAPSHGHGELILLVDDDASVRETIGTVLTESGYRVLSCADGVEAIVSYQTKPREVDLVITDVDMPNLNGAVLATTLRQLKPEIRIIAISGLTSATNSAVPQIRKLVQAFLEKPFSAAELLRTVDTVLHPPA